MRNDSISMYRDVRVSRQAGCRERPVFKSPNGVRRLQSGRRDVTSGEERSGLCRPGFPDEVNTMALTLEEKKAVVAEVSEVAKGAFSAVAAEYTFVNIGYTVNVKIKCAAFAVAGFFMEI